MGDEEVLPDWGYQIDRGITTDEDAFNDLLARARRYRRQGDDDSASGGYRDALNAWHGQNAYEDVRAELVEAGRSRLAELRGSAVEEFASVLLDRSESGGPAEALELTAGLIAGQPLRERPYHLAMLAAYRSHRQADALTIFQTLRRRLRTELGIEPTPTPATARLHALILRQDRTLEARGPRSPVPATVLVWHQVWPGGPNSEMRTGTAVGGYAPPIEPLLLAPWPDIPSDQRHMEMACAASLNTGY